VATRRVAPLWHAMLHWNEGGETAASVVRDPEGAIRGSIVLDVHRSKEAVNVREMLALEPDAARTLLAHLAGFRGIFKEVNWRGSPADPFAALLRDEPAVEVFPAMFRLLDVPAALGARGYPAGVEGRIELDVADDSMPSNAGPVTLTLDGTGAGHAEPGGAGTVSVTVQALAALYTGHARPHDLAVAGGLQAPAGELGRLERAFAGPQPWIADRF
jgi:predicted acetyltransferase